MADEAPRDPSPTPGESPQAAPAIEATRSSKAAGLVALNAALLVVLALVAFVPTGSASAHSATAQQGQPARAPGAYTMVAGDVRFGNSSAVWLIDSVNQELVGLRWNNSRNSFEGIGYRNIAADLNVQGGRR